MYPYLSKLSLLIVDPFSLAVLLGAAALLSWKNRGRSLSLLVCSATTILLFASNDVSVALLRSLENQYPDVQPEAVATAQAIVVLGGTVLMPSSEHLRSSIIDPSDRLLVALRLYRAGKAPVVVCSGGSDSFRGGTEKAPEAEGMRRLLEEWGVPSSALQEERDSTNTRENAALSYRLLAPQGIRKILLVTSAFHMPRAAATFRKAGFDVTPAPANFRTGWGEPTPLLRWIPSTANLQNSSGALREWLALLVYRSRGWA